MVCEKVRTKIIIRLLLCVCVCVTVCLCIRFISCVHLEKKPNECYQKSHAKKEEKKFHQKNI